MEYQLTIQNNTSVQNTPLKNKEIEIAAVLTKVNMLAPFPLNDLQIEDWSKTINRLMPDLKITDLNQVLDNMIIGKVEYDNRKGIQNIFNGLASIERKFVP
jgi:hypothetical protein